MKKFFPAIPVHSLIPGKGLKVRIKRNDIALFRHKNKIYAVQNNCPHQGADLSDGYIKDGKIHCALHHWAFELSSGTFSFNPDMRLKTYEVRIKDDMIYIGFDTA